jgi:transposase-like protein
MAMGFSPEVILTDGDNCYPGAIKQVFKKAVHQLCIFHVKTHLRQIQTKTPIGKAPYV